MQIVYIASIELPSNKANSIQVMKMCQAMTQLGHTVNLVVPGDPNHQITDKEWAELSTHYGLSTRFEIQYLPRPAGIAQHWFEIQAIQLARLLNSDLVYTRSLPPAVIALLFHHSAILEMHQLPTGRFGPLWFQAFLRLRGHKRLVVITHSLRQQLQKLIPSDLEPPSIIAPSGVDLERFSTLPSIQEARRRLGLKNLVTGVCTGHLYPGRGMELVISLAQRLPEVQFLWVGGNESEINSWQKFSIEKGITNLTFSGFRDNASLPLYQAAADFLMIPYGEMVSGSGGDNITSFSSPMKVFEYLATGRPIIASDLPVLHEVLNDTNALFCTPGDVATWESAIRRIMMDPLLAKALAEQAKTDAACYTWVDRARKILANF